MSFWQYFDKIPEKPGLARCVLCEKEYSFKTTTTNLKKHLECKHANAEYSEDENEYIVLEMAEAPKEINFVQDEDQLAEPRRSTTPQKVIIGMPSVWDHYEKIPGKKCWARCNICKKECCYETSICNLIKHLMRNHVNAYNNLLNGANTLNTEEENPLQIIGEQVEEHVEHVTYESDSSYNESIHSTDQDTSSHTLTAIHKHSNVWKYFEKLSNKMKIARCCLCSNEYSYKTTSTNLKCHLKNKHKRAFQDLMEEEQKSAKDKVDSSHFEGKLVKMTDNSNSSQDDSIELTDLSLKRLQKVSKKKSPVWDHFQKLESKKGFARCNICKKDLSFRSTISNLKNHLKKNHVMGKRFVDGRNIVHNEDETSLGLDEDLKMVKEEFNPFQNESVPSADPRSATPSPPPRLSISHKRKRHDDITTYTQSELDETRKSQIDNKLLELFIQDYQPFSIVEDQGFKSFVRALNPYYELPNKKLITGNLIPKRFLECKKHIMKLIQAAKSICITIDCWKSLVMDSYFSVTAHFMLNFKFQTILIYCDQISEQSNISDLAASLKTMAQEYRIEDKISLVVSEYADNMKKAIEINQWPFFGCFLQKLNLIIEKALEVIDFIIEKVKNVVDHFEKNHLAADALLKYQTDNGATAVPLIPSDQTRWNSVFYMLQRFLKLKDSLKAVAPYLIDIISSEIWEAIKHICMILQPFEEATRVMNDSQYLKACLAVVITDGLKNVIKFMKNKSMCEVATAFIEELENGLKSHFSKSEIEDNVLLGLCTFLDPRFKIHAFLDNNVEEETRFDIKCPRRRRAYLIKEHVLELVKAKLQDKQLMMTSTVDSSDIADTSTMNVEESETISIWGKIDKNIAAVTPSTDDLSFKAKIELDKFLNDEVVPRDSCPLSWWKAHEALYPNLADIFFEHCHLVVTSVKCDQIFTIEGKKNIDKRARLSRKHTAELVFLNFNKDLDIQN